MPQALPNCQSKLRQIQKFQQSAKISGHTIYIEYTPLIKQAQTRVPMTVHHVCIYILQLQVFIKRLLLMHAWVLGVWYINHSEKIVD